MQTAAKENDIATLKELISSGNDVNEQYGCYTPLILAAYSNNYEAVKILLENKADAKLRSKQCELYFSNYKKRLSGLTPLQEVSDIRIAKILVEYGANPNQASYHQYTIRNPDVYDYNTPLKFALENMNLELISFYLKQNVSLRNFDMNGKNVYKKKLDFWKVANPEFYKSASLLFKDKDISDLEMTAQLLKATENLDMDTYMNIHTKKLTTVPREVTIKLKTDPNYFGPVTYDSDQKTYFHYIEFTWVQNNQNLWEWFILRKKNTGN